jgi:hypothetical protein
MAWNTENANSMEGTFKDAVSFNQPLAGSESSGGLDTSSVQNMDNMLDGAISFDQDLGGFDVTSLTSAALMCNGIQLSTENYDSLLNGWASQAVQSNVVFDGGLSTYSATGQVGRDDLTDNHLWTITDGGGGGVTIYNVNSATLNGSTQYFQSSPISYTSSNGISAVGRIRIKDLVGVQSLYDMKVGGSINDRLIVYALDADIYVEAFVGGVQTQLIATNALLGTVNDWLNISCSVTNNDAIRLYVGGNLVTSLAFSHIFASGNIEVLVGEAFGGGSIANIDVSFVSCFNRAITSTEVTTIFNGDVERCFELWDTSLSDDCFYAPRLANYGANAGQELVDQSSSNATTTNSFGPPPYTDQGLQVEC